MPFRRGAFRSGAVKGRPMSGGGLTRGEAGGTFVRGGGSGSTGTAGEAGLACGGSSGVSTTGTASKSASTGADLETS